MKTSTSLQPPLLSVVVIGRNEGERLSRCLQSVLNMRDPKGRVEIIYVDSNSQDDSIIRAEGLGVKVIMVKPERPSAALGRNAGWREAKGEYVLFLDGDTVLHPDFVDDSMAEFNDPSVAVVWGHRREIHPEQSLFNRVLDLDWIYPPGPSEFCGGDAIMRRSVLEEVGGFNAGLIAGEEPELCQRIRGKGYTILHVDRAMTGHDLAMTRWSAYWRRAFRAGYAYADVSDRLKDGPFPLWVRESKRNLIHAVVLLVLTASGILGSILWPSWWPLMFMVIGLGFLSVRTAIKVSWKSKDDWLTLLLYGIHSHFQQIPIFAGQLAWFWDRRRHLKRQLIEYK
jgi:cellulose synthase/poly-beta-1,6-N-acetylglucosamine synthase-like glycosyltransferase